MTDEIEAKSGGKSLDEEDSNFDPASEDETKVVIESLEPPKAPDPSRPLEAPKTEAQPKPVPAITKMKKPAGASRKKGGVGVLSLVAGPVLAVWKRYRGIRSTRVRRAVALGVGLLAGVGVFFVWPAADQEAAADPTHETCEFLARPAARLYIDGELASPEVPPIHRTRLGLGQHTVRFVSPDQRAHEATIEVVGGKPTQWFMNFVSDRLDERPLISEREDK